MLQKPKAEQTSGRPRIPYLSVIVTSVVVACFVQLAKFNHKSALEKQIEEVKRQHQQAGEVAALPAPTADPSIVQLSAKAATEQPIPNSRKEWEAHFVKKAQGAYAFANESDPMFAEFEAFLNNSANDQSYARIIRDRADWPEILADAFAAKRGIARRK